MAGTRRERASSRPVAASRHTTVSVWLAPGISAPGISVPTQTRWSFGPISVAHSVVVWGIFQTVSMPLLPILYAATMDVPGNTYVGPHGRLEMRGWPTAVRRSQRALDPDLAKALWARSEELTGVGFPG